MWQRAHVLLHTLCPDLGPNLWSSGILTSGHRETEACEVKPQALATEEPRCELTLPRQESPPRLAVPLILVGLGFFICRITD